MCNNRLQWYLSLILKKYYFNTSLVFTECKISGRSEYFYYFDVSETRVTEQLKFFENYSTNYGVLFCNEMD